MQTPAERALVEHLAQLLPAAGAPPARVLAVGAGRSLSIEDQLKMVRPGVYFEHCFTGCMPHSDRMDPGNIVDAVRAVGPENCILSTDFGQITNPPPVEGMRMYIEMMLSLGINPDEITTMIKTNPAKALGLPINP